MPKGFAELHTNKAKPWVTLVLHEGDFEGLAANQDCPLAIGWPQVIVLAERCFFLQNLDPGAEVPRGIYREVSCHFA